MPTASWQGVVIAQSDATEVVEGNHYFPRASVHNEYVRPSSHTTTCGWKGVANYFDIVVGDQVNEQAAWYYADPKPDAKNITGYVAFWKGVEIKA